MPDNDLQELVRQKIDNLRLKLLDLTRRNPLLSTKLSPRSNACIRVVDELPDVLFYRLNNGQQMRIIPLPDIDDDPRDEDAKEFVDALANARLTEAPYLSELEAIDQNADDYLDRLRTVERALKDRLRAELGLPARPQKIEINLVQHARNNGITPSYELPEATSEKSNERHTDDNIQTLLLPKDLERKLSNIIAKCKTWIQETGINVLQVGYGFLEWSDGQTDSSFAPLILSSAQIEKKRTSAGIEFWISGLGDEPELNTVLAEMLRVNFGIELPAFADASVEAYFAEIANIAPNNMVWRLRRQVAIGVFPSARMAMYHDIDPARSDFPQNDIIKSLLGGSGSEVALPFAEEYNIDEPDIEKAVPYIVMDADSSQFSALVDVANGKNLAVEGPPGTGKSQTIINAIAAAIAQGKKVLFVAEKLAALNVVRSRLEALGLGEFLLPLQAERSMREQVIASVRARVEMSRPSPARDYKKHLAEYNETRAQLAEYIEILTSDLESTGLTVHQILSKSIATAQSLEDLPSEILEQVSIPDTYENVDSFTRLRAAATMLEQAFSLAEQAPAYWKSTNLKYAERFTVEEICTLAARASSAFQTLARLRAEVESFGLRQQHNSAELKSILDTLEKIPALSHDLPSNFFASLLRNDSAAALSAFIQQCKEYTSADHELQEIIESTLDADTLNAVDNIIALCEKGSFETLDHTKLQRELDEKRKVLDEAMTFSSDMTQLIAVYPEAAEWKFTSLAKARQIVAQAGRSVLICRNSASSDPSGQATFNKLCAEGKALHAVRERLKAGLSLQIHATPQMLLDAVAALRSAGMFAFFSKEYRQAKRLARSLLLAEGFDRRAAIRQLEDLASYRINESAFMHDPLARSLFGVHFRGIDTDFTLFGRLAEFNEIIRLEFANAESRGLYLFLRDAEMGKLELIPLVPAHLPGGTLQLLQDDLLTYAEEITIFAQALEQLRPLLSVFKAPALLPLSKLRNIRVKLESLSVQQHSLDNQSHIAVLLGDRFKGTSTACGDLAASCEWASNASTIASGTLSVLEAGRVIEAVSHIRKILNAAAHAEDLMAALTTAADIDSSHFTDGRNEDEIATFLKEASADHDGFFRHAALATAMTEIDGKGIKPVIDFNMQRGDLAGLASQIEALIIRKLAKKVYAKHGKKLARYTGSRLDELRSLLAEQDRKVIKLSQQELRSKIYVGAKPPSGNGTGRKSTWSQMALIENEINKEQRFISVRDLTQRAGEALLDLKPCWMMSPLAVAQYVPKGKIHFDLCIIDEASQMPPEASIGALLRCNQTMIVGDTNQLPPSSFFKKMMDGDGTDDDADETVLEESILEMANATFRPPRRLRWHYRSRHSGLIKFSNRLVYDDDLIVFPSASENMARMGIVFQAVDGLYKAGTNPVEARAIVDAALEFMVGDPDRSLGIVTLNQKQRDLIQEEFNHALGRDRRAQAYVEKWKERKEGLEEFFIKNLENVQGDERDVIFIGTVYGPETQGARVAQRFGPINGLAGKRRLNVLFSRAKEKIVTFSSMTSANILANEDSNVGAYMLKRWLEYAASGVLDGGVATAREPDSDFEIFVINQIKAMGYEPVAQVGVAGYFIDIGVRHPSWPHGFVLGVECDGASYHSAKSARDRDRLRQEVLEGLGWRFHRIWSTDWFNHPQREAERLRGVLIKRMEELKTKEAEFTSRVPAPSPPIQLAEQVEHCAPGLFEEEPIMAQPPTRRTVSSVNIGDTVRVRYLSGDCKVLQFTISEAGSDLDNGIIHHHAPIAKALLGAEEGDEVEVLTGPYVRSAVVENIIRGAQ